MCVVNGGQGVSILSGGVAAVMLKTGVWQMQRKSRYTVIPAQAGIQKIFLINQDLDSRLRGNDEISIFYFNPQ
ncbi:hypothetical protein NEICINOT_04028 [Neisseria cinerea ATCC 14685]|uniref:Uncharacterized protein n=1 Tax=Neisseria cinerea ATCC 14685 TaxID=546262 RepID=D0W2Z3_NEICI|nr:hypothetical protein NEICINOT_04028 [Neisseria cinerea ATCC 14685]